MIKRDKELNKLLRPLLKKGFILEKSKHFKLHSPDGRVITTSASPSVLHRNNELYRDIKRYFGIDLKEL